jgi:hypothetical protein
VALEEKPHGDILRYCHTDCYQGKPYARLPEHTHTQQLAIFNTQLTGGMHPKPSGQRLGLGCTSRATQKSEIAVV